MKEHSSDGSVRKMKKRGSNPVVLPERSIKTLANSIYTTLREEGCEHKDIIGVSSKLIGLVTQAMENKDEEND